MLRVKRESKAGQSFLARYERATARSVEQFYKKPSSEKINIERHLLQAMLSEKGEGYKVIAGNAFYFTAAWLTPEGLRVETVGSSYIIV